MVILLVVKMIIGKIKLPMKLVNKFTVPNFKISI